MSGNTLMVFAGFVCAFAPVVFGETRCPERATSLPLRLTQGTFFVASVKVNGTGPYDFLVDTGAQVNAIDGDLATVLHLTPKISVGVVGAETYTRNPLVLLDLQAGGERVTAAETVVVGADQLRLFDRRLRGILGGTFLEHFDFLLDNQHQILCLDQSGALWSTIKGQKVELADPRVRKTTASSDPFTQQLIVSARLSGLAGPRILLLDSGSNSPVLFLDLLDIQLSAARPRRTFKRLVHGVEQDFTMISPQDVRIGGTRLPQAEFAAPLNSVGAAGPAPQQDGVLPTMAFRRIFVSCSRGYVVLESWN